MTKERRYPGQRVKTQLERVALALLEQILLLVQEIDRQRHGRMERLAKRGFLSGRGWSRAALVLGVEQQVERGTGSDVEVGALGVEVGELGLGNDRCGWSGTGPRSRRRFPVRR